MEKKANMPSPSWGNEGNGIVKEKELIVINEGIVSGKKRTLNLVFILTKRERGLVRRGL